MNWRLRILWCFLIAGAAGLVGIVFAILRIALRVGDCIPDVLLILGN